MKQANNTVVTREQFTTTNLFEQRQSRDGRLQALWGWDALLREFESV